MDSSVSRRLAKLALQLSEDGLGVPFTIGMAPTSFTSSSSVQREIQLLLEHDSHAERQAMKDLMKDDLFIP